MLQSEHKDGVSTGGGARSCAYLPTFSKMTSGSLGCQIAVKRPLIFFLNVLLVTGLPRVHKGLEG